MFTVFQEIASLLDVVQQAANFAMGIEQLLSVI